MLALRELQMRFVDALFSDDADAVSSQIEANGVEPAERLEIYRNNLREGFTKALSLGFPVVERLVGVEYFKRLALDFQHAHPSRAGNLHHIGLPFPQYLRQRFVDTQYSYLGDVAALEWAREESMLAADEEALAASALAGVDPARYAELQFRLHPACGLVKSRFPIVPIWRANQAESNAEETIDLDSGGDLVLVRRTPECIEFHCLPPGEFAALEAFARGAPLGDALDAALATDAAFDLAAALQRFFALNLITGVES